MNRPERSCACISVVLPVLNEQAILLSLIGQIGNTLTKSGCNWNIVVVNDGSTDAAVQSSTNWLETINEFEYCTCRETLDIKRLSTPGFVIRTAML
jgi:Glycosyl transferase family 2